MSNASLTFFASMKSGDPRFAWEWQHFAYALLAGALAGLLIWVVCKIADYIKSRFVKPFMLPPETAAPKFQLRVTEFLLGSALYGIGLFAASALLDSNAPEQLMPWALYLLATFVTALLATGDLCRGGENENFRGALFCCTMLLFTLLLPFGLLLWWVWRRWQRVQRAVKNLERTTLS